MIDRLKTRLNSESGFTLIELLVVIIILGILLAIAIPSYLSFKDRANKTAAAADIRAAVPSVASYAADNTPGVVPISNDPDWNTTDAAGVGTNADTGVEGMTWTELQKKYDSAFSANIYVMGDGDAVHTAPTITGLPTTFPTSPTDATANSKPGDKDPNAYCIWDVVGTWYAWKDGDQGQIQTTQDPTKICQS